MTATTIGQDAVASLQELKGATLRTCSGYRLFENPDIFYGRVRLDVGSKQIDITNRLKDVVLDKAGPTEEIGILSIEPADSPIWLPDGEKVCRENYSATIIAIFIVEDTVKLMNGKDEMRVLPFSQAIVFQTSDGFIGFDKGAWFDEYITVTRGDSIESVIRDCSEDWITDEPIWNELSRNILEP